MKNPYSPFHIIDQDKAPEEINLIVEVPTGCTVKYEYNKDYGIMELDRTLFGPNYMPINYCDVPRTWNSSDNDPLDAALYCSASLHPGTLVRGRVIGVMEMDDNGETDHKILCVASKDPRYKHVTDVDHLTEFEKSDLKTFMETYKIVQTGYGTVKVGRFLGKEEAYKIIRESMAEYDAKFPAQN